MFMQYIFRYVMAFLALCVCGLKITYAQENFLPVEQAFIFESRSINTQQAELNWQIAPEYYLYKYQFKVTVDQQPVTFELPKAKEKHDIYYGDTEVYEQQITFKIQVQPQKTYQVEYQGCAEKGLCYPPVHTNFSTDTNGLVILQNQLPTTSKTTLFGLNQHSTFKDAMNNSATTIESTRPANIIDTTEEAANDQSWSNRLQQQSFVWSILVFLGLGCLLAFTPCSLPMLPILSSLLIRKNEGVKAIFISLTFVLCMASVYALLGVLAASAGTNFQRWLQQPWVLMVFSTVFIIFALNLFGLFELKLPQAWANRLDRLQANQQGGTLVGAGVMGMLSALLVGPCMTAPLAGTLLYISQTQNMMIGASLLFTLGIGMGIPMLLLTLVGQKALPKPGMWMNYVRHIFAFLMLGLSLYFVRPLLSEPIFYLAALLIIFVLMAYLIWLIKHEQHWIRATAIVLFITVSGVSIWQGASYWQYQQNVHSQAWTIVQTKTEFDQALQQAKAEQKTVVIDLYADWCIACQPLEREVWAHPQVQIALDSSVKIKVDLSEYHPEQQQLLTAYELLGPPTALFIDTQGQEQRSLRLTGSFKRDQLLAQLKKLHSD